MAHHVEPEWELQGSRPYPKAEASSEWRLRLPHELGCLEPGSTPCSHHLRAGQLGGSQAGCRGRLGVAPEAPQLVRSIYPPHQAPRGRGYSLDQAIAPRSAAGLGPHTNHSADGAACSICLWSPYALPTSSHRQDPDDRWLGESARPDRPGLGGGLHGDAWLVLAKGLHGLPHGRAGLDEPDLAWRLANDALEGLARESAIALALAE